MSHVKALIKKESLQIIRDPSSVLIAFVLPLILLFIFGYGINLDSNKVKIGLVLENVNPDITSLATAFTNSRFLDVKIGRDRREFQRDLVSGRLRGIVVVPQNFTKEHGRFIESSKLQVIADGSEPNTALFVQNYVNGVVQIWLRHQADDRGGIQSDSLIQVDPRFWYNAELKSKNSLIPGSIAIIITLIGTLLTALVISREWERGTMEALMATPVSIVDILVGKIVPYFLLGIGSMLVCSLVAVFLFGVPLRGSVLGLLAVTSVFLICALGQGLLISSIARDHLVASLAALMSAFLPAFMLSGFIFEISSMPTPIQVMTHLLAVRYFVTCLQTIFLAGSVKVLLMKCMGAMALIGGAFFLITISKIKKRLD